MRQAEQKTFPENTKPIVAISFGDPAGIGPEIIAKSLSNNTYGCFPVVFGSLTPFKKFVKFNFGKKFLEMVENNQIGFIQSTRDIDYTPGILSAESGKAGFDALQSAAQFCKNGYAHALVTAPVSKKAITMTGIDFSGHTGFLSNFFNARTTMMLFRGNFRIALLTEHIALSTVARYVTVENIVETLIRINDALKQIWKIRSPKIAVLGLNPHAGENGEIGTEDKTIENAINRAKNLKIEASGPIVPDIAFIPQNRNQFDAYLAMYHDQGLIPLKMNKFHHIVNITLGLPIIRTSPGHGTAFDIAGKGIASPVSFVYAYRFACKLVKEKLAEQYQRAHISSAL